jgi:hypothetical protein
MEIKFDDEKNKPQIHIDKITNGHIIVAIIYGYPTILSQDYNNPKNISFKIVSEITSGNSYSGNTSEHLFINLNRDEIIRKFLKHIRKSMSDIVMEVFLPNQWREALQWLMDNSLK